MLRRFAIVFIFISLGSLASYYIYQATIGQQEPAEQCTASPVSKIKNTPTPKKATITLTAAGDCLMHNTQIWSGLQADGSYCFDSFFPEVRELIMEGDYSSINFEAAMAGPDSAYTGYPLFNSPDAMAQTLKEAGFDLVATANNHCLDRGVKGAIRTLKVLEQAGLDTLGTYKSEEDSHTYLIKDIKGVKVAYLAYTYGTNGIPLPDEYSFLINFLDEKEILADIKAVRPQVDVLVLVLHWGLEYNPRPSDMQKRQAYSFLEAGADVILGSHPHVIQTMEKIRIAEKDKFVIYSMGNFISHQIGQERNSGIVLKMKFTKDFSSGNTLLDEVSYTPTFSHSYQEAGKMKFRVVPVEKTIEKIEKGEERILSKNHLPLLQAVLASTRSQLGEGFSRK
jgi:poly-gamma-glutamate synthesis protein (capsule biosynthesis protein)